MSVWDIYQMVHPGSGPCPQPHRLKYFAYAMALVADEIEAKKFGIKKGEDAPERQGVDMRLPGGSMGFKPTT